MGVVSWTNSAHAKPPGCEPVANNLNICTNNLNLCTANLSTCTGNLGTCSTDLGTCNADLAMCDDNLAICTDALAAAQVFPGDGYDNPDAFGVSGHGPMLSYTDNGDGTFTDDNNGFMWEKKDDTGGIHNKDNPYTWTDFTDGDITDPDGTLFTVFLDTLNTTCDGDESISCNSDADCGVNGPCGFAGHGDWCIPNVKELQSIVNYSTFSPASSVPGLNSASFCWAATTNAFNINSAWLVNPSNGDVFRSGSKGDFTFARAVRP